MLAFEIIVGALVLGYGFIIGTILYHTKFSRVYRITRLPKDRLVEGEREANDFPERKS